jgi:hypothetical protein
MQASEGWAEDLVALSGVKEVAQFDLENDSL